MSLLRKVAVGLAAVGLAYGSYRILQAPSLADYTFPAAKVSVQGYSPQVVLIPQSHPVRRALLSDQEREHSTISDIADICTGLYDNYGVKTVVAEGITPALAASYEKKGKLVTDAGTGVNVYPFLNTRKWTLLAPEDPVLRTAKTELEKPIRDIQAAFRSDLLVAFGDAMTQMYERAGEVFRLKDQATVRIHERALSLRKDQLENAANEKITSYFNLHKEEFNRLIISTREEKAIALCAEYANKKQPVALVYGVSHTGNFEKRLKVKGLEYIVVDLKSLSDTPHHVLEDSAVAGYLVVGDEAILQLTASFDADGRVTVKYKD